MALHPKTIENAQNYLAYDDYEKMVAWVEKIVSLDESDHGDMLENHTDEDMEVGLTETFEYSFTVGSFLENIVHFESGKFGLVTLQERNGVHTYQHKFAVKLEGGKTTQQSAKEQLESFFGTENPESDWFWDSCGERTVSALSHQSITEQEYETLKKLL